MQDSSCCKIRTHPFTQTHGDLVLAALSFAVTVLGQRHQHAEKDCTEPVLKAEQASLNGYLLTLRPHITVCIHAKPVLSVCPLLAPPRW
eukprot:3422809-Amphidinium_carterae.1